MYSALPLSKMIEYEMTDKQFQRCESLALKVTAKRKPSYKTDWNHSAFRTDHYASMIGFAGEFCFHQIISVYFKSIPLPDMNVHRSIRKIDFEWKTPIGTLHEVKSTVQNAEGGVNYVREDMIDRADVFWFMSTIDPTSRSYWLRGYVTADELQERGKKKKGRGKWVNYVIETDRLNPVSNFLKLKS